MERAEHRLGFQSEFDEDILEQLRINEEKDRQIEQIRASEANDRQIEQRRESEEKNRQLEQLRASNEKDCKQIKSQSQSVNDNNRNEDSSKLNQALTIKSALKSR